MYLYDDRQHYCKETDILTQTVILEKGKFQIYLSHGNMCIFSKKTCVLVQIKLWIQTTKVFKNIIRYHLKFFLARLRTILL